MFRFFWTLLKSIACIYPYHLNLVKDDLNAGNLLSYFVFCYNLKLFKFVYMDKLLYFYLIKFEMGIPLNIIFCLLFHFLSLEH